ncbi:hypothetical protein ACFQY0_01600 [Haloferula chungangensis]|uniref:Uncharacterized protein n=1 Tax=Haloferula chungangensis TaxID=1048331 RepID=A0ABW2L3Z0_9BACT
MKTHLPCVRVSAEECDLGDWLESSLVPDWHIEETIHHFVIPGQIAIDPVHQIPSCTPLITWAFRIERGRDGLIRWIRIS